jgi:hypothetical protein
MNHTVPSLPAVLDGIAAAADAAGRDPRAIRLIAVSKGQPVTALAALTAQGQWVFGENYMQEALPKIAALPTACEWHFLGPLQRNKARFLPARFAWLHSLSRLSLAQTLAPLVRAHDQPLKVLLEINVTADPAKHGLRHDQLDAFLDAFLADPELTATLDLRGLMTIGRPDAPAVARARMFADLRRTAEACRQRYALPAFTELSMGMSDDYALAIAEGATMVRIGRALFGPRPERR